ncbi:ketopantoate reductase family protein [Streptomyces sp. NPDC060205]|uniref:ketopantoate reductase family protein n=1 Tax=Streptomyces sp. NPDC060205 TaxID=3347072 RepID=UPI00365BAB17
MIDHLKWDEHMPPRIAVLGAGANGASIGADLTRAGHDVTLIEQWPEHVRAMQSDGVRIVMPDRTLHVPVVARDLCDVATLAEPFDVVLILMKAYDTRWAVHLIEPLVAHDGVVVGVQNGMTTDAIVEVVGPHRTLGSVIEISSMMNEPGIVQRHSPPDRSWFAVGEIAPAPRSRVGEIVELLSHSGTATPVGDIRATKWMKLISNCTTLAMTAMLDLPVMTAATDPDVRALMLRSGQEAADAGVLLGYQPLPIFGLSVDDVSKPDRLVELLLDTLVSGFVLPSTTTTVAHDWSKGRRSEVADINGAVVAAHAEHGGAAPVNAALVRMARRIERGESTPGPERLAELRHLIGA